MRITNRCDMGCSHCMIDASGPDGAHMAATTFMQAVSWISWYRISVLVVSGGEPTAHPDFFNMMEYLQRIMERYRYPKCVVVASNGTFLSNDWMTFRMEDLKRRGVMVQVTNDPRYYPRRIPPDDVPNWVHYEDRIRSVTPCRRTSANNIPVTRQSPHCFNLRSVTRSVSFAGALTILENNAKVCAPSINVDGTLVAGEMDTCAAFGTVFDQDDVTDAVGSLLCDRCGLHKNLSREYLSAVGMA